MAQYHVEVSHVIDAPADKVYDILADYHTGHPAILPKPAFSGLKVEQGGRGAGTVAIVRMQAMGGERSLRLVVTEPQPGRVLVETDESAGTTTTFTVEPISARQCRITISTDAKVAPGLQGWVERLVGPFFLRRLYRQELHNLAEYERS